VFLNKLRIIIISTRLFEQSTSSTWQFSLLSPELCSWPSWSPPGFTATQSISVPGTQSLVHQSGAPLAPPACKLTGGPGASPSTTANVETRCARPGRSAATRLATFASSLTSRALPISARPPPSLLVRKHNVARQPAKMARSAATRAAASALSLDRVAQSNSVSRGVNSAARPCALRVFSAATRAAAFAPNLGRVVQCRCAVRNLASSVARPSAQSALNAATRAAVCASLPGVPAPNRSVVIEGPWCAG
jgi:hypothetical protein